MDGQVRGILLSRLLHPRLVHTEWLFLQKVAGGSKSASAASHANVAKLAEPALALEVICIPQLVKDG